MTCHRCRREVEPLEAQGVAVCVECSRATLAAERVERAAVLDLLERLRAGLERTWGMDTLTRYQTHLTAQGYSAASVRAMVGAVAGLLAHADVDEALDLDREDLEAWLGAAPRADWTRLKYLSHVKAFCAWAGMPDLTEGMRRPRQPQGVPRPVAEHDLAALLASPLTERTRAWVVLGAYCGLRSFESAKVAAEDLEHGPGGATLRVLGKGGQWGIIPAPPIVLDALAGAVERRPRGRLWPAATAGVVQQAIRAAGDRCGVVITSHMLRHRYGTAVHAARGDLLITQRLMRHRSPATTAGYALVASTRAAAVVEDLPGAAGSQGSAAAPGRPALMVVR